MIQGHSIKEEDVLQHEGKDSQAESGRNCVKNGHLQVPAARISTWAIKESHELYQGSKFTWRLCGYFMLMTVSAREQYKISINGIKSLHQIQSLHCIYHEFQISKEKKP